MKTIMIMLLFMFPAFAQQQEETEALRALRLSCEKQKVGLGCFNYANMLIREEKPDEAETYYEKGCKLEHSPSCQKEKWDLPDRVKVVTEETAPVSPAPASVDPEAEVIDPPNTDFSMDPGSEINL